MGDKTITKSKRVERETAPLLWGGEAAGESLGVGNSISPNISPLCHEIKYGYLFKKTPEALSKEQKGLEVASVPQFES